MKTIFATFLLASLLIDPTSIIIDQPDSPVTITAYVSLYREGGPVYTQAGIHHRVYYSNTSERKIVAVQFGLVSFNLWNEFLDRTQGVGIDDLDPGDREDGVWIERSASDFFFLTGVAYVSKVRFSNGDIWSANLDLVTAELRKIEKEFDAANLSDKEQ